MKFSELPKKTVQLNSGTYNVMLKQLPVPAASVPRLVIASKLPDQRTIPLLRLCIETIRKFTTTPYELWVVDNNSPLENLTWLLDYTDICLVLNRTPAPDNGSTENALALELAANLVPSETEYFMSLHQDTAVCKKGWLSYLLSKFTAQTKAVGVREDKVRVKEGVLHVLGYIIDFQLFKKLNLSFMPELPVYDVGDKAIVELRQAGYTTFATPNSLWNAEVVKSLPADSIYKQFNVDRSIDDDGDVFFLHLGRGLPKSMGVNNDPTKTSVDLWQEFIEANLLK